MKHPYFNEGMIQKLYTDYQKYGTLYIAFDFDNTIWNFDTYKNNYTDNYYAVYWDIIDLLKSARECGLKLILWTSCPTDEDLEKKTELCGKWGIKPDYVNMSPLSPNAVKPHFNLLLDDKAGLESSIFILTKLIKLIK